MATIKIINGTRGSFPQQHAAMINDQLTLKQSTGGKKTYAMQSAIASLNIGLEGSSTTIFEVKLHDGSRFQAEADKYIVEHLSKFAGTITREPYIPPSIPQGAPAPEGRNALGWTITVIVAATFFYWCLKDSGQPAAPKAMSEDAKKLEVWTLCQMRVKESLKSPNSASFPWKIDVTASADKQRYTVVSYVEAKNAFGVELRTNYVCSMKFNGGGVDGWTFESFAFEQ